MASATVERDKDLDEADLDCVVRLLSDLVPEDSFRNPKASRATVYTWMVTLWLCTLQRLRADASLEDITLHLVSQGLSILPDNKRVREKTLSSNTGAFCKARKRLPLEIVRKFADQVCNSLIEQSPPLV